MPSFEFQFNQIGTISKALLSDLKPSCFCLQGEMGTGKTTLVKALVKELGAVDIGNSPTFGLVNEYYDSHENLLAYHFDFYRINSMEEAMDIGLEEYFASDVPVFIEWPERIEPLLPEDYHKVSLYFIDENTRRIEY